VDELKGHKAIFRSLQYRNYRLFFMGQILSLIGTWTQQIALPWLVYRLTGSKFLLGLVGFATQIPAFLVAPFAGVMADRWNRYRTLLATQTLSMLQALLLTILFFTGHLGITNIIILAIFLGLINAFDMPTRQSFVISLVENREDLGNAIALNSMMFNSARLIGPAIAGIIIAASNEGVCFAINAVSFLFVIASLLMMKITPTKANLTWKHVLFEFREGFAHVSSLTPLKYLMLLLALVSLTGMSYSVLMPVFADKMLHGGPGTFGLLMSFAGIGAMTGAAYLASRKTVLGLLKIIPLANILFGLGLITIAFSNTLWLALPLMFIIGLGMMTQMAASNTIIQTIVDDDKRGRIMSFYVMAFIGTAPFGSLLAGTFAEKIGVPYTLAIGGSLCVLGAAAFAIKIPDMRKNIRPIYVKLGIITQMSSGIQAASNLTAPPED
jgi:MFS family permease